MNKNQKLCGGKQASGYPVKPLRNEKSGVPGQQIGLYNEATKSDVAQMVTTLNSPEEENQKDRG